MLGINCGLSENVLDECSYIAYKDYINELSVKFQYDAVTHILSNPYAGEEGQKIVQENNPFNIKLDKKEVRKKNTLKDLEDIGIKIIKDNGINNIPLISDMLSNLNNNQTTIKNNYKIKYTSKGGC